MFFENYSVQMFHIAGFSLHLGFVDNKITD